MDAGNDGVLFGRQSKTVIAERVQDIESIHALVARKNIGGDVTKWVANVQAGSRWVRKHIENKQFVATCNLVWLGQWTCRVGRFKGALALPNVLPLDLHLGCQRSGVTKYGSFGGWVVAHYCAIGSSRLVLGWGFCRHRLRIVDERSMVSMERQKAGSR